MVGDDHDSRARLEVLEDFADELIGAAVDALDRIAELRRERGVVHRVRRIDEPPHHVLDAVGRFDDADQHVPVAGVDAVEDHLRAIVERLVEVVHERLLVHAALVQRPRRLGPAERAVVAEPIEEVAGERRGRRDRQRRIVRLPVHRRDVELQLVVGVHQQQLRHAVDPDEEVDAELEVDPAARRVPARAGSTRRRSPPSRSSPRGSTDRQRQADVFLRLQLGDALAIGVAQRRTLGANQLHLLPNDRVRRSDQLGPRDVAAPSPAAGGCRRSRCCLPRSGSGRSRSRRRSPSCRGCRAAAARRAARRSGLPRAGTSPAR